MPLTAGADPADVRREVREGAREIDRERHEAAHEIRRCETRECEKREAREGKREMDRERHEARHEIQAARGQVYWPQAQYARSVPYYLGDTRYYGHAGWDRVSHIHPSGHYCRDVRHVAHYRDGYYRNDGRWYRDGRYWSEVAYVNRYYRRHNHDHDDDDDDLVRGIAIGAAVVGVIAAVHEAYD